MNILHMLRWVLAGFGLVAGVIAGNMFLVHEFEQGFAFLAMSAVFLLIALLAILRSEFMKSKTGKKRKQAEQVQVQVQAEDEPEPEYSLTTDIMARKEIACFVANLAVQCLRDIGRTIPPSQKEIDQVEEQITGLLDLVGVKRDEREQLLDDLDKIRGKIRRAEGSRALMRGTRL